MRLIGTLDNQKDCMAFSQFLDRKGIAHRVEVINNLDWGSPEYGSTICRIWIDDEDQVDEALQFFALFQANRSDPIFETSHRGTGPTHAPIVNASTQETPKPVPESSTTSFDKAQQGALAPQFPLGVATRLLILICCLLFFISAIFNPVKEIPSDFPYISFLTSPIEKELLYDYPHVYQLIDRLIHLYGFDALKEANQLPPEGRELINQINHTPYWQGIYTILLKNGPSEIIKKMETTPMFEKIRQGEIWRLITPDFLHANIFHLFFNMLWLFVLGKQIEQVIKPVKYLILMLIIGVISNTCQYLMSGPNFIGYSGILVGMLTFIWMRQRVAPWEGYRLDKATIYFLLIYVLFMAAIQFFSFFLEKSFDVNISPGMANMAHLSGGIVGLILGRTNLFIPRNA